MLSTTKIISICIITFVIMASCTSIVNPETGPNNSSDQVSVTESASVISLAQTLVSNTNYLDECKTLNHLKLTEQIPYQNIWPGKTKESEVESILGIPDKRSVLRDEINWVYGSNVGLIVQDGIVTSILVSLEDESWLTLEEVILKYGCPNLIMAVNTTVDQVGYNDIRLIYSRLGLAVSFPGYPANLSTRADAIWYFPMMTVQEYFEKNGWARMPWSAQPIEWEDAVK
jgi:hypothetical protein